MARLIWSPRAISDLDDICGFIARDSEHYAQIVGKRIVAAVERVPDQPFAGSIVPEFDQHDVRERFVHSYRIIYRIRGDSIDLVTITHAARLLSDELIAD